MTNVLFSPIKEENFLHLILIQSICAEGIQETNNERPHEYAADEQNNICTMCAVGEQRNIYLKRPTDKQLSLQLE
jgi:hypothetical protein